MKSTTPSSLRAWIDHALCAQTDPDIFFPPKGMATRAAVRICQACPVRVECLAEALDDEPGYGLWGGLTPNQRARERKRRASRRDQTRSTAA